MPLVLSRADNEDCQALADLALQELQSLPLLRMTFPFLQRPKAKPFLAHRFRSSLTDIPTVQTWKVHDEQSRALVGYAQWEVPASSMQSESPSPPRQAPQVEETTTDEWGIRDGDINYRLREYLRVSLAEKRAAYADPQVTYYLGVLQVVKSYQGRGIGSSLVKWGLQEADRHSKTVYTEVSPDLVRWYQTFGFVVVDELAVDLAQFGVEGVGLDQ